MEQKTMAELKLADDRLRGMKNIAEFIGEDERRCYYLATKKLLPGVFREGNAWVGLKSAIRQAYERAARGAA
jgi:hypothetical protein